MNAVAELPCSARGSQRIGTDLRYPGPKPFEDDPDDRALFFGRDVDARLLASRIESTRLLVVYGKSGLGKTSLLKAGVFPLLREHDFFPVTIRLNRPDLDFVPSAIDRILEVAQEQELRVTCGDRGTLWTFFKTTVFWRGDVRLTPVLVLDQFEEIFTLQSADGRAGIARALGELARTGVPASVRSMARVGEDSRLSDSPPLLRLVFSLREDYVGTLHALFADIPSILNDRFRLEPLTREQARCAVLGPSAIEDERFAAAAFAYDDATSKLILDYLQEGGTIEPFQLQVICNHIESERLRRGAAPAGKPVDASYVRDATELRKIEERFYFNALRKAYPRRTLKDWRTRRAARRLCELGLLGAKGSRQSLSEEQIAASYGLTRADVDRLVEVRLLRVESRLGAAAFELTHDSLAKAIKEARSLRISPKVVLWVVGGAVLLLSVALVQRHEALLAQEEALLAREQELNEANAKREYQDIVSAQARGRAESEQRLQQIQSITTRLDNLTKSSAAASNEQEIADLVGELSTTVQSANTSKLDIEPEMVPIESGCFVMGAGRFEEAAGYDEMPQHNVCVRDFEMSKYEITFDQYDAFARATQRPQPSDDGWGRGKRPVRNVTWEDANEYVKWLSGVTGGRFRLPSEAEWEYAARAGSTTVRFWGDDPSEACKYAKVNAAKHGCEYPADRRISAHSEPVGAFAPNAFGLYDMLGNVWEWVQDCYHKSYEGAPSDGSAWEGSSCQCRVLRGGTWSNEPYDVRSAERFCKTNPSGDRVGFRVARDAAVSK